MNHFWELKALISYTLTNVTRKYRLSKCVQYRAILIEKGRSAKPQCNVRVGRYEDTCDFFGTQKGYKKNIETFWV